MQGGDSAAMAAAINTSAAGAGVTVPLRKPKQIWFAGTGAINCEWGMLPGGGGRDGAITIQLQDLEEQGDYTKYVATVEAMITAHLRCNEADDLIARLWRQMVVAANAFGMRYVEQNRFAKALEMLKRAEHLAQHDDLMSSAAVTELKAFVADSFAYYYYKRGKPSAALAYVNRSMRTHMRRREWDHVAKCHLHTGAILARLNRHDEAIRVIGQVLELVEEGKLDVGGTNAQKICLVSVTYHNIAVEQLHLRKIEDACVSSQNSRRLARLSLSYSNRWLRNFENTHKCALRELALVNQGKKQTREQMTLFEQMTSSLFT